MRPYHLSLLLMALMAVIAGCSSLLTSDAPPESVYWLEPLGSTSGPQQDTGITSIRVRLSAAPGLDTDRLLIRGPGAILNSYAGARWADNAPEVLDTLIRSALEDSGRFNKVISSRSGGLADWTLDLELRAFFAVVASESSIPEIEIEFRGYLQCAETETPMQIASQVSVSRVTLTAIVEGFQGAVDASLRELLNLLPGTCTGS